MELEKKIPDVNDFVKKVKLTELENKIHDISNLATKIALTTVENIIRYFTSLVKKKIMTQKLLELKINLIIIIMTNILELQSVILWLQMFFMQDWHKPIW